MKVILAGLITASLVAGAAWAADRELLVAQRTPTGGLLIDKASVKKRGDVASIEAYMFMNPPRALMGKQAVWTHAVYELNCANHRGRQRATSYHDAQDQQIMSATLPFADWIPTPANSPVGAMEALACRGEMDSHLMPVPSLEAFAARP